MTPEQARQLLVVADNSEILRLLADAELGARVRQKNRLAARQRRHRDLCPRFVAAVERIRANAPHASHAAIATRLLGDFGNHDNVDPLQALTRRVNRCLAQRRNSDV